MWLSQGKPISYRNVFLQLRGFVHRFPKKLVFLFIFVVVIGNLGVNIEGGVSPVCETGYVDIVDEAVLELSLKIHKAPAFPVAKAWLKSEAARYGTAVEVIPKTLETAYTLDGRVPVKQNYFDQAYLGNTALSSVWTIEMVDSLRKRVRNREAYFTYENTPLYMFFDKRKSIIEGKRGLVIGSESPWLESMLLEYGALQVTTLEFGKIKSEHPQLTTYTPDDFKYKFLTGQIDQFDFVFSYSSLEHDGLGRYGDVLNPNGDLETMAKLLHCLKPGGYLMVGVPCCYDGLEWNAHRIYGPQRLPLLFAGYQVLGIYPQQSNLGNNATWEQPLWVLQNTWSCNKSYRRISLS